MAEAAKQRVAAGFAQFDRDFSAVEAKMTTVTYNDTVKGLNSLIALLNPLGANFDIIGGTGKKEDIDCVNELITGFNGRMKSIDGLGARAKAVAPPPQPRVSQTSQTVNLAPPPKAQPSSQKNPAPIQSSEPVPVSEPLQQLPSNVVAALQTFDGIYDSYTRLIAQDVWTGRSNDLVNRWASFCDSQAPIISQATSMRLVPDAMNRLKDFVGKFNTFAQSLTSKIESLQINDYQKQTILRFGPDHDAAMTTFKNHINGGNRAILDAQYQIIQNLERGLRNLQIDSHPQVSSHLAVAASSLAKMADVFSQQDAYQRQQQAALQQHQMAAKPQNQGLEQHYEEPALAPPLPTSGAYQDFLASLERENELIEETFDLPVPASYQENETIETFDLPVPAQPQPQAQGPKFCGQCGTPNAGKKFCGECGFKFGQ